MDHGLNFIAQGTVVLELKMICVKQGDTLWTQINTPGCYESSSALTEVKGKAFIVIHGTSTSAYDLDPAKHLNS